MNHCTVVGIDLAKNVLQLHALDRNTGQVENLQLSRTKLKAWFSNRKSCHIAVEACGGAHYWADWLRAAGHDVHIYHARHVRGFLQGAKHDRNDAQALCSARRLGTLRPIPTKTKTALIWQMRLHRRDTRIANRTKLVNQVRALLLEVGTVIPKGINPLRRHLPVVIRGCDDEQLLQILEEFASELNEMDEQIKRDTQRLTDWVKGSEVGRRLMAVPGIGVITASTLLSHVPDPQHFRNGRGFASWCGLVPDQNSSGGKTRLLGISKRGSVSLRRCFFHGARALARVAAQRDDPLAHWLNAVRERRGMHKAIGAGANKLARICWHLMASGQTYQAHLAAELK